jgi:hypothetical protein
MAVRDGPDGRRSGAFNAWERTSEAEHDTDGAARRFQPLTGPDAPYDVDRDYGEDAGCLRCAPSPTSAFSFEGSNTNGPPVGAITTVLCREAPRGPAVAAMLADVWLTGPFRGA